jgi:hypothetical protein
MLAMLLGPLKARHHGDARVCQQPAHHNKMNATMGISVLYAGGPFDRHWCSTRDLPRRLLQESAVRRRCSGHVYITNHWENAGPGVHANCLGENGRGDLGIVLKVTGAVQMA